MREIYGLETIHYIRQLMCQDQLVPERFTGKPLRSFVYALCIAEFGFITSDQAKMIPLFTSNVPIVEGSAHAQANRELKQPYFYELDESMNPASPKLRIFRLTEEGFAFIADMMGYLFAALHITDQVYYPDKKVRAVNSIDIRDLKLTNHSIMINTQSILAAFQTPLRTRDGFEYHREFNLTSYISDNQTTSKTEGSVVSDFVLRPSAYHDIMAMEVDLDTERSQKLFDKIQKYDRLYYQLRVDPIFLFDPNDSLHIGTTNAAFLSESDSKLYEIKHSQGLTDTEISTLLLFLDMYTLNSSGNLTLDNLFRYVNKFANENPAVKKTGWYDVLTFLHTYLDKDEFKNTALPETERGKTQLSNLPSILSNLRNDTPKKKAVLISSTDKYLLKRRRKALFECIRTLVNKNLETSSFCGILSGMTVCASFQKSLWKNLQYIYPRANLYAKDVARFRHLGLISPDNTVYQTSPKKLEANGMSITLKNSFLYGDYLIAFENISEDIGGIFRMLYYLNMPYEKYKDVLLIALIDNDLSLANGQSLDRDNIIHSQLSAAPEGSIGHELFSNIKRTAMNNGKLRVDLMNGAGLVFMTYREFDSSYYMPIEPFMIASQNGTTHSLRCQFT